MSSIHRTIDTRYQETISTLNALQTNQSSLKSTDERGKSLRNIQRYLSLLNVQLDQLDRLNIIHVAGTKGKGSTCALIEAMLRQYGYRTGFFSSPHLIEARERIRINGELISKEKFVEYFWRCHPVISNGAQQSSEEDPLSMPFYFSFLTTMMFYVFVHEKIDVAIIEVGIGGEYDCTNVIKTPIVCGITSLGLDHVKILGNTVDQIAWQKAGIFKRGVPAISVPQPPEAMRVLYERAEEKQCSLMVAPPLSHYSNYPFRLSLAGDVQEINASLAVQLVFHWLHARAVQSYDQLMQLPFSKEILQGLATCRWSGRNELIETSSAIYYIDGAHTIESIEQCKHWFLQSIARQPSPTRKILVFYCSNDREPDILLQPLMECKFDQIAFCSPVAASLPSENTASQTDTKPGNDQWRASTTLPDEIDRLSSHVTAYEKLRLSTIENLSSATRPSIHCFRTVSETLTWIDESKAAKPSVLVTGSLYLVGAFLKSLQKTNQET